MITFLLSLVALTLSAVAVVWTYQLRQTARQVEQILNEEIDKEGEESR